MQISLVNVNYICPRTVQIKMAVVGHARKCILLRELIS